MPRRTGTRAPRLIEKSSVEPSTPTFVSSTSRGTFSPAPVDDCEGEWKACEAGSVRSFSAVAYYFGRRLHEDLDVPIGLIGTYWGGSTAEAWMTRETLERFPEMDDRLAFVQTIASDPNHGADALAARIDSWWQRLDEVDPGHRGGWHRPGFSDRSWDVAQLPGLWDETALGAFDGIVWYRRTVRIPNDWDGRELTLQLGPIDDMDTVWFNGRRVGGMSDPGTGRRRATTASPATRRVR
jgi:sialate O-acetylesterase